MEKKITLNEKKVLFLVMAEMAPKDPQHLIEFPDLSSSEIKRALDSLASLKLIRFDADIHLYRETEAGMKYIDACDEFDAIKDEFEQNSQQL